MPDKKDVHVFSVPDAEFVAITFPGLVKNDWNAIDMLDLERVARGMEKGKKKDVLSGHINVNFRPDDAFSHPLEPGLVEDTSGLLLKVKVKKTKNRGPNQDVKVELLGRVTKKVTFPCLSDFQVYTGRRKESNQFWDITDVVDDELRGIPLIPRNFADTSTPKHEYALYKRSTEDTKFMRGTGKRHSRGGQKIAFETEGVPTVPTGRAADRNNMKKSLIRDLRRTFDERPMWSKDRLIDELFGKYTPQAILEHAEAVAYRFWSGPFRTIWTRFGYDPRIEPEAKKYQVLDFRLDRDNPLNLESRQGATHPAQRGMSKSWRVCDGAHATTKWLPKSVWSFTGPPNKLMIIYQLCDIEHPKMKAMLQNAKCQPKVHKTWGWLKKSVVLQMRRVMKQQIDEWVVEGVVPEPMNEHANTSYDLPKKEEKLIDVEKHLQGASEAVLDINATLPPKVEGELMKDEATSNKRDVPTYNAPAGDFEIEKLREAWGWKDSPDVSEVEEKKEPVPKNEDSSASEDFFSF